MVNNESLLINDPWGINKRELRNTIISYQYRVGHEDRDFIDRGIWYADKDMAHFSNIAFIRTKRNVERVRR